MQTNWPSNINVASMFSLGSKSKSFFLKNVLSSCCLFSLKTLDVDFQTTNQTEPKWEKIVKIIKICRFFSCRSRSLLYWKKCYNKMIENLCFTWICVWFTCDKNIVTSTIWTNNIILSPVTDAMMFILNYFLQTMRKLYEDVTGCCFSQRTWMRYKFCTIFLLWTIRGRAAPGWSHLSPAPWWAGRCRTDPAKLLPEEGHLEEREEAENRSTAAISYKYMIVRYL